MKDLLRSAYPYIFFLLLLVVPFDEYMRAVPNILLVILGVSFPFIIQKSDFKRLQGPAIWIFCGLLIFLLLNALILQRFDENFSVIKKILISLSILILYLPIKDFKPLNRAVIFSALIAIGFSIYHIGILIYNTGDFEFGNSRNPLDTLLIERLYIGLLCTLSILVSYKIIFNGVSQFKRYHIANIIINIFFIFLIVSRIAIVTLIVLVLLNLFYRRIKLWKIGATVGAIAVVMVVAFTINDNLEKRFLFTTPNNADQSLIDKIMLWEPRTKIWECSYIIGKTNSSFLEGLGFDKTVEELVSCYEWNIDNPGRREWFLLKKYNTHNQFIDFYLSTGILSVLLFIGLFLTIFLRIRENYFKMALLLTIVLFAFVENFFHRQIGAYYFGVILIYLLYSEKEGGGFRFKSS